MNRLIKKRVRGFLSVQFPLHLLSLLILWLFLNTRMWAIFVVGYIAIILIVFLYEMCCVWRYRREQIYAGEVQRLMLLVRDIADAAFVYGSDRKAFYDRVVELTGVESLRLRGIIDPDALLGRSKHNALCRSLDRGDAELFSLIIAGFDSRALKVIYRLGSINSVYVKRTRLKKRLPKEMLKLLIEKEAEEQEKMKG
jgi:hypothetical protein